MLKFQQTVVLKQMVTRKKLNVHKTEILMQRNKN